MLKEFTYPKAEVPLYFLPGTLISISTLVAEHGACRPRMGSQGILPTAVVCDEKCLALQILPAEDDFKISLIS
jgi:hypothetical protein